MKKLIVSAVSIMLCVGVYAQSNIERIAQLTYNTQLNDIWGYVAEDGTEYALVGMRTGLSIVSLADHSQPVEVAFIPGQLSVWRDIKTYKDVAYVTTDGNTTEGLQIIDLSQLPQSITVSNWRPMIPGQGTFDNSHNIYIDQKGYGYVAGSNLSVGQVFIIDLRENPLEPTFVGFVGNNYSHDVYVQDNLLYSSEVFEGQLTIYDVSSPNSPTLVGSTNTPFTFTHNAWSSTDNKTVFTTDERRNAPVAAYDISDLSDIKFLDEFRPKNTLGTGVAPHNVHVIENWLAISYYSEGAIIVDASRPNNLIQVGDYDTSPNFNSGFNGAWGLYPFLPSGHILVSDIENGFYVLKPNYIRACYLEGVISDATTGTGIFNARIELMEDTSIVTNSSFSGEYKTGTAVSGTYTALITAKGYVSQEVEVQLLNGILTPLNVALIPIEPYRLSGQINEFGTDANIPNVQVFVVGEDTTFQTLANEDGFFEIANIQRDTYDIVFGKWGYQSKQVLNFNLSQDEALNVTLEEGYQDDFFFDFGWETDGTALSGRWIRAKPNGTKYLDQVANPDQDVESDFGSLCYVTGNRGIDAEDDDVDGGNVILTSPEIDLTDYETPVLSFNYWFFNAKQGADDTLTVQLINELESVILFQTTTSTSSQWQQQVIRLSDFLSEWESTWTLSVTTSDQVNSDHIVEAGFDNFLFIDSRSSTTSTEDVTPEFEFSIYPNPFTDQITIEWDMERSSSSQLFMRLYDINGKLHINQILNKGERSAVQHLSSLPSGMYMVALFENDQLIGTRKIIK
ncbi:MAG: choice-of-anchor B family protein [Bacteroidota bacterium]